MSQLWMSLEGPPGWHVHHGNAHRLDTTCKYEAPTTSLDICLASSRPLHTPPASAAAAAHALHTHPNRDTRERPETTPGWTHGGGGALRGYTPSRHPKPPPTTRAHSAGRPELETVGRGEGGLSRSPGAGQREWGLPIPAPGSRILHAFKGAAADYSGREPYPPRHPACPPCTGIKGPGEAG